MRSPFRRVWPLLVLIVLAVPLAGMGDVRTLAQSPDLPPPQWQVFLQRDLDETGADLLTFLNSVTGAEMPVAVSGERYVLAGDSVLYFESASQRLMQAYPDGRIRPHPFIQPPPGARRLDWIVSPDDAWIAWTITGGQPNSLTTLTTVARLDGSEQKQSLVDGPRDGIRILPVAFSPDALSLYMDFQPDGVSDFTPYPQYAGLVSLDIEAGTWAYLPEEPGCFCGAGFGNGLFLRLKLSADGAGFDLRVHNLPGRVSQTIPARPLRNYTQAGDILLSPDGSKAVYALAQIRNFGAADQSIRTVFMLADLSTLQQRPLADPITTFVDPLAWTEDNSAIIFTSRQRDGTWKISLTDGTLDRVADATFLGLVR